MTIEIHEPELEALIRMRMEKGRFRSVEEVLIQALQSAPLPEPVEPSGRTERKSLARIFAESPFKGLDIDFPRDREPLREVDL